MKRRALALIALVLAGCAQGCGPRKQAVLEEIAVFDTEGWAHDVTIAPEGVFVADRQGGYLVFDRSTHWKSPRIYKPVADVISLAPNGGRPLLASRFEGLVLVSERGDIRARASNGDIANSVAVRGNHLFAAYGLHGLVIAELGPSEVKIVSELASPGWAHDVKLRGGTAFIADWNYGLQIVDIRDPVNPSEVAVVPTAATAIAVAPAGWGLVAVAEGHAGISIVSLASGRPVVLGRNGLRLNPSDAPHPETGGWAHGIAWAGRYLLVANWKRGLAIVDAADLRNPRLVLEQVTSGTALGVTAEPQPDSSYLVLLADGEAGLRVFRFRP